MKIATRTIALLWIFVLIFNYTIAQQYSKKANKKLFWIENIQNKSSNFEELQDSFYEFWKDRTDYKGNGYKIFKRWEYINEFRILPDGTRQAPDYVYNTYKKYMLEHPQLKSASGTWSIVAPYKYPTNNTSQPTGMGRVNAIAFHPTDGNIIFVGSPSGGFWKTTNGGTTWSDLSANMPTLGVSSILVHPSNPDIIYLGSGDRDSDDAPGMGVFKSTDGGASWTNMNSTMGNVIISAMIMHPSDPNIIIAATSGGIYKTTNGASSWSAELAPGYFKDIKFKPGDPTIVYAIYSNSSIGARFYRSIDTGESWTQITSGIPDGGTSDAGSRMVIGVSPDNANYVYLLQIKESDETFRSMLRSSDSGLNFSTQSTSPNILGYECDGSGTASQAAYDLCITVDPTNADVVYVGGINNWKSTDGGVNWAIVSHWASDCGADVTALHADQHCYEWNNGKLYVGHDGGISYTANNGTSWTEITNNLAITQVYKLGQSASNNGVTLIGLQDNGSAASINGNLYTTRGGDGMECLVDFSNENYCYNTYSNGDIDRSSTGPTGSYSSITEAGENGIGAEESGAWVTPYALHKNDASTMFVGYENVYRTSNVKANPVVWEAISSGETSTCRVLEQSPADNNILYIVRSGILKRTDNANAAAASVSWTACTLPGGSTPTDIKAHYTDANIVYATAGYNIYKSTNKGASWTDISGTLPNLWTNCLVIDKNTNEGIYIGNQTGVWYKNADMPDWELFSTGLPAVDIRELEIYYDPVGTDNRLKAATYGRGLWESDLHESGVLNPTDFTATASSDTQIDLSWALTGGNNVVLAYNTTATFGTPTNGTTYTASSSISGGGTVLFNGSNTTFIHPLLNPGDTYYYKIWSYDGSENYSAGATANETTTISVADFNADNTISCTGSLLVNFTDASTSPYNSWAWDIDNNLTTDYTTQNTSHTYSNPGLYSVKFTINNGSESTIKENMILVMDNEPTANTGCTLNSNNNDGNIYGIGIYRFALNNIDNTTSHNDRYYQNYCCSQWTTLETGKTYDVTIQTGTTNEEGARVYIDYNDDGNFEESEKIAEFDAETGTRTLSYTVPTSGITMQKGLRLRVLSKFGATPDHACDIDSYGQAEDYTVYFTSQSNDKISVNSGNWSESNIWSPQGVPTSTDNVYIKSPNNVTVDISGAVSRTLTVENGSGFMIGAGKSLTVDGNLLNDGTITVQSDASANGSLIVGGASSGNITYNRYVTGVNKWHLISSPVGGQDINNLVVTNATTNAIATNPPKYGLAPYNNTIPYWDFFTNSNISSAGNFVTGKGYEVLRTVDGIIAFTGSIPTGDVNIAITTPSPPGNAWNLVGNPYPSVLYGNDDAHATNNFLSVNLANLDPSYGAFYVWDANDVTPDYIAVTQDYMSNTPYYIAPGQSIFVYSKTGGANISFTEAMRTYQADNIFKSTKKPTPNIKIIAENKTGVAGTYIKYIDGKTTGLDPGYDAGRFTGINKDLSVYTHLVGDNQNKVDFEIQCLPANEFNHIIPLGIDAPANSEIIIRAEVLNLPFYIPVFLEDKANNFFINLRESGSFYSFTPIADITEIGRFYIHTNSNYTSNSLNTNNQEFSIIPRPQNNIIRFIGKTEDNTIIDIYDLGGRKLLTEKLNSTIINDVKMDGFISGIYIVTIHSSKLLINKKISWIKK